MTETQLPLRAPPRGPVADGGSSRAERTAAAPVEERSRLVLTVAALAAFLAAFGVVGSDALWFVPLGDAVAHGHLPGAIPYAVAPSSGWHDVPALGQLVFWAAYHSLGGARGLVLVQTVAVTVAFGALAHGLRRETSEGGVLLVSSIVLLGSLTAVVVTAAGLFSVALFAVLLALLEADARAPGRRIWWSVPLLGLWGNLHGGVLAGLGLLTCYLVVGRARRNPGTAFAVLVAGILALGANPMLWRTPDYYAGVLQSEVARRGEGLWAPLGDGPFDRLLIAAAVTLVILAVRRAGRVRLWEAVVLVLLAVGTAHIARNGVWLLFVAAYPAARALRVAAPRSRLLTGAAAAILAAGAVVSIVRGPVAAASPQLARAAARAGEPVLAEGFLGQQAVLAGGRVWIENPIDAFRRTDQRLYLDWLAGRPAGDRALDHASYVLVRAGSDAGRRARRDPRLTVVEKTPDGVLYRVKPR
jgi:hypothetical protein